MHLVRIPTCLYLQQGTKPSHLLLRFTSWVATRHCAAQRWCIYHGSPQHSPQGLHESC
jgi:hypothetical protein